MFPALNQNKRRKTRLKPKKKNKTPKGENQEKKLKSKRRIPKKPKIKKYPQPNFKPFTDTERLNSEPEDTHVQSCDEDLLAQKDKRNSSKKNLRFIDLNKIKSKNNLSKKMNENLKYNDPYEIYLLKNEKEKIRRNKTLKEVESTLALIKRDKEEIENYVLGRSSIESKNNRRRESGNNFLRKKEKFSRSQIERNRVNPNGEYLRGGRELSKVKSDGELRLRELGFVKKNEERIKKVDFAQKINKNSKKIDLNKMVGNSKKYLKSSFKSPINFSDLSDIEKQLLGDSEYERKSLPARLKNKMKMKKTSLTPLITDSPTLKLLGSVNMREKVVKSSFREYVKSQREREDSMLNKEEQRSVSVESGLEKAEGEEVSYKNICGFALRTVPGKKNGARKINQDSAFYEGKVLGYENLSLYAVFDGHGPVGHKVSKYLSRNLLGKIKIF